MFSYVFTLPDFLLLQYKPIAQVPDSFVYPFLLLLIPGWIYTIKRERTGPTLSFGLVILVSTVLSAAVTFGTDGTRAMYVTHPFVATMFATGFATPASLHLRDDWPILSWRLGIGTIITVMLAFLFAPPLISHVIREATAFDPTLETNRKDLLIVPGGRFTTGFLVLPDAADLPHDVPALHASTLAEMIPLYDHDPEPRLSDLLPRIPFALVYCPVQNWRVSQAII
jgi:hypothetical protein